jgi:PAS domain S-box-containing protein
MGIVSAPRAEAVAAPPAAPQAPSLNQWSSFVCFGAALSTGVGLLCLAGWMFDISILKSGFPGLVQIKANTAVCLILLGVALWLRKAKTKQTGGRILVAQALAGLAAVIGLASLGEYFFGWDLGIDQLLFVESPNAIGTIRPGLMAPINALNLLLLGSALVFLDWTTRRGFWPSQLLSFAAGLLALFNLLDFVLAPREIHTYTSLPAAVTLAVFSLALICARPQWSYGSSHETALRRWFFQGLSAERPQPLRYGGAVLLVGVATILRDMLGRSYGMTAGIYTTFYPVVLLAAVLGGLGPGILATALSAASAAYFFLDPPGIGVEKMGDVASLAIFTATGVGIAGLAENLERIRRQSADVLRKASSYTRSLIEASLDPLVTISPEGKITDVNKATEDATGIPRSELVGTDFASYFTEPEKARLGYRRVFDQGLVTDYPLAIRHISGKITEVLYNATLYRDEKGSVAGVFAAARDITERKRAEQELAVYHQNLEDLVAQRTAEIQSTNKSLESANQELETFAYSVSHDLRTPLRAVDGFSRILLEDYAPKLDAEGQRVVNVIREGTRKMAQMIDDILAFSRAGRLQLSMEAIDMEELVREALKSLQPALAGGNVKVEVQPLPGSQGDASMIQRLWTNLLDNAIKFTRTKPGGAVEVGSQAGANETIYYVKDNGIGFDERRAHRLYGVFQRLHGGEEYEGTGVGLAIVKRIIERHGGRVWAEGKVGEGATFYFALPQKRE